MAVETVLMYNCNGEQWAKLRQIFLMLRVRIRSVEANQYGLTLEDLLGRSEEKAPVEEEFSDPMLVFCNLPHEKLDRERWLGKARRSSETAPAAIFANPVPSGPGGIAESHSIFARRK